MTQRRVIRPASGSYPELEIVYSSRRKRTVAAQSLPDGRVRLLVPDMLSDSHLEQHIQDLVPRVVAQKAHKNSSRNRMLSDDYLTNRAAFLLKEYLPEGREPVSIRWVANQKRRWGSATPAQLTIRVSNVLVGAPEYVVDYVIFHELCHLVQANHSAAFRALEARYPHLERARAFLQGLEFAEHTQN
ncbi:M48 family metallopeptidase [Rothia nasimurium]|uniref:M48 metallopeptidase family protein n=1 Tax=Rothia nasimurium TaxID=85336 RepID=UPI001F326A73|nr:M48 family metallopeptidase [Rothia nasimurium]